MLPLRSSLPRFRIKPVGVVIASLPLLLAMIWLFRNPDASFRSSDSNWAGGESSFKAYSFKDVAFSFEAYRLKCRAESAQLVRTTKMNWWNVFAWYSYATNPKWNVPYGEPGERIGPNFRRGLNHCANSGFTPEDIDLLRQRSVDLVQTYADGA